MSRDSFSRAEPTEFELFRRTLVGRAKPVANDVRATWFEKIEEMVKTVFPEQEIRSNKPGLSFKLFFYEVALPGMEIPDLEHAASELSGTWRENLPEEVKGVSVCTFSDRRDVMFEFVFDLGETYVTGAVKLRSNTFGPKLEEGEGDGGRPDRSRYKDDRGDRPPRRDFGDKRRSFDGRDQRRPDGERPRRFDEEGREKSRFDDRGRGGYGGDRGRGGYGGDRGGGDRDRFGGGGGSRGGYRDDRGPRRDFGDRPPRRDFGDRPPRRDFNDGDRGPRRDFGDRPPRRDFGGGGDRGPRRDFGDRPPRRDFNDGDRGPRRDFGDRPPRRDFGGGGGGGDRPRGSYGSGRPSGGFGGKKFGKPGGGFGGKKFGKPGGFKNKRNDGDNRPPRRDDD